MEVSLFSDEFKVVDVNTEDQFKPSVEKETFPPCDRLKITLQEFLREVVFRICKSLGGRIAIA